MEDGRLAVSLVSELAEERVPCRETRTGLEKSASGITGAVRKTMNSSGCRETGRTISHAVSDLNLASNPADKTTVMPAVPSKSCVSANRNDNATRRQKWTRQINREVMFCYYHVLLSCKFSAFRKPMHQLWCKQNPSLTDVSEHRLADQKQYLLTSGSLTESELEEIKREAAQDGKPVSDLLSVTTDVCPGVQMSALDVVSALSADSLVVMPLLDNVSPCMASVRMVPAARGGKPIVSMMQENHEFANHLEDGSLVQSVTVLSKDCSSARGGADILSLDDTLDSVQCCQGITIPCDSVSSDLMTTHPSIASRLERMETPTSQLSPDCCQTEDGLSLDTDAAVDPALRREFLEKLQKVRQIPICERQCLPRIFVNSGTLKFIGDLNTIISSLKDEPDMNEISYLVYSAASLVSKRRGLKTTKSPILKH